MPNIQLVLGASLALLIGVVQAGHPCSRTRFFAVKDNAQEYYACDPTSTGGYSLRRFMCQMGTEFSSEFGKCVDVQQFERIDTFDGGDIENPTIPPDNLNDPTTEKTEQTERADDSTTGTTDSSTTVTTDSSTTVTTDSSTAETTDSSTTESSDSSTSEEPDSSSTETSDASTSEKPDSSTTESSDSSTSEKPDSSTSEEPDSSTTDSADSSTSEEPNSSTTETSDSSTSETSDSSTSEKPDSSTSEQPDSSTTENPDPSATTDSAERPNSTTNLPESTTESSICAKEGFLPQDGNCSQFVICYQEDDVWYPTTFDCPEGMQFNPAGKYCSKAYDCNADAAEKPQLV